MNWYIYRRSRGALILILLGVVFLLEEAFHWHHLWPLFLIGLGVILLMDRFIAPPVPPMPPPGAYPPPYGTQPYPPQYGTQPYPPAYTPPPPPENPHS